MLNKPLTVLITNNTLAYHAGSELYAKELAISLLQAGHKPIAYSTNLGAVAEDLRRATVPVIDDLNRLTVVPDLIHGQHHIETMTALMRFPGVPAVYFCHGWLPWEEAPPQFPRILRYVAVDDTCKDRLILESGIPQEKVQVILNFVNTERFHQRDPLPVKPQKALVFSNYVDHRNNLPAIQAACAQTGLHLDIVGVSVGKPVDAPEKILGNYDIVFAKGKSAIEAMAVGAAVVLCDSIGMGPLVSTQNYANLRRLNFGIRTMQRPCLPENLIEEIKRYSSLDAREVSTNIRLSANLSTYMNEILTLYSEVIEQYRTSPPHPSSEEAAAFADYMRWFSPRFKSWRASNPEALEAQLRAREAACLQLQDLNLELQNKHRSLEAQINDLINKKERLPKWMIHYKDFLNKTVYRSRPR